MSIVALMWLLTVFKCSYNLLFSSTNIYGHNFLSNSDVDLHRKGGAQAFDELNEIYMLRNNKRILMHDYGHIE